MRGKIHIGTSGWNYEHWKGRYYPEDAGTEDFLKYYCRQFDTVEINNTFYQLPGKEKLENWMETVPEDFIFSVKAGRYVTHMKKLKDPADSLDKFMSSIDALKDKMGAVLFQLPPRWSRNTERLKRFLAALPGDFRYVFEFRDESWFDSSVYELLEDKNAAFCIYHLKGGQSPGKITADIIYIRLHGPGDAYEGGYDDKKLSGWAGAIESWRESGRDVYCYFNNDEKGYAPRNAERLKGMLE